jgi:hypothetical protein
MLISFLSLLSLSNTKQIPKQIPKSNLVMYRRITNADLTRSRRRAGTCLMTLRKCATRLCRRTSKTPERLVK